MHACPACLSGERHVFVAVDSFTRFVHATAATDVQASSAAEFLNTLIGLFGSPEAVLTDNAPTFCSSQVRAVLDKFGVSHRRSTPEHHQGSAQVERVIQSLQEKLALITHDPALKTDWRAALPSAILSLNTTVSSATGYTPFELLFGRKHASRTTSVVDKHTIFDNFAEFRELNAEVMQNNAIAYQSAAQQNARRAFERHHVTRSFEVGERVFARLPGRRNKLQNRWQGPYQITAKNNDIYSLVSDDKREKLERHVSQLRAAIERSTTANHSSTNTQSVNIISQNHMIDNDMKPVQALILLLIVSPSPAFSSIVFFEAPTVSWVKTDTLASPAMTTVVVHMIIGDPCAVLHQFNAPATQEVDDAVNHCYFMFEENILRKLDHYASMHKQNPTVLIPQAHNNIGKRGLTDFMFGTVVLTVVDKIIEIIWPHENKSLDASVQHLNAELKQLQAHANFTQLELKAVVESQKVLNELVMRNVQQINHIKSTYPRLAVVSANIVSHIVLTGALIDRLAISIGTNSPDLATLIQLTGVEALMTIDASSIKPTSCKFLVRNRNIVTIEFQGYRMSKDTGVYRVLAFSHHADLLTESKILQYDGPHYVYYNTSSICAQGLKLPPARVTTGRCDRANYEDKRLQKWRTISPAHRQLVNHHELVWPHVYVYCYYDKITIQNETADCPPYPLALNAQLSWNTSTESYQPDILDFEGKSPLLVLKANHFHLKNQTEPLDKIVALKRVEQLIKELDEANNNHTLFRFGEHDVTYEHSTYVVGGVALVIIAAIGIVWIAKVRRSHQQVDAMSKEWITMQRLRDRSLQDAKIRQSRATLKKIFSSAERLPSFTAMRALPR